MFGWFKKREPDILVTGLEVRSALESAKLVLAANEAVQFGIFGVVGSSDVFPPREFLNQFFAVGGDPCDQDGRMFIWEPFSLSATEYAALLDWWLMKHSAVTENRLDADCWDSWIQNLFDRLYPGN